MIYLFVWERYFRQKQLTVWKEGFQKKYDENNLIHIVNVLDYDISFFEQNLFWVSLFSSKNMLILDDFPFWWEEKEGESFDVLTQYFLENLKKVTDDHIVIFNSQKVDKRSKLYKEIVKIWEVKDFTLSDEADLKQKLEWVFWDIFERGVLDALVEKKWLNFSLIVGEIEKLLLTKERITMADLEHISKQTEESIFEIINDILQNNMWNAIKKLKLLSKSLDNPYYLYNSFASNMRFYAYIFTFKILGKTSSEIKNILPLGNRAFLVDRKYAIDPKKFVLLYQQIAALDGKMKTWNLIWNDGDNLLYEIEKFLLK